jgi:hypothetical protein
MTSAQLILVSVSSALIAVIAMLVVATVLRARTRESTGGEVSPATGPQTRAQRAAARAQKKAQKATTKAERKAAKATASVAKAEKDKAAALAAVTTKPADGKPPLPSGSDPSNKSEKDGKGERVVETKSDASAAGNSTGETNDSSAGSSITPTDETDVLAVPEKKLEKDDEVATTEAGKKASEAKPKARKSLLGRTRPTDDAPEEKS